MTEKREIQSGKYEVVKEGLTQVMHINFEESQTIPSIETDPLTMASSIDKLAQTPQTERIIFHQKKLYEYNEQQTRILKEIAQVYNYFLKK